MPIAIDGSIINRRRGGVVYKARAALDFAVIFWQVFPIPNAHLLMGIVSRQEGQSNNIFALHLSPASHWIDMQYAYSTLNLLIESIVRKFDPIKSV